MKGSDDKNLCHSFTHLPGVKVGGYVVAHPPIAQIFLRLERVHVCVDVLVLHYIFHVILLII